MNTKTILRKNDKKINALKSTNLSSGVANVSNRSAQLEAREIIVNNFV